MHTKEEINEQVNACHEKLEVIMESLEKGEDIYHALINFDATFETFYDRWVLFFTDHECPVHPKQNEEGPTEFYVP